MIYLDISDNKVVEASDNMNYADVTECGGIWLAFQLLEASVNLKQYV